MPKAPAKKAKAAKPTKRRKAAKPAKPAPRAEAQATPPYRVPPAATPRRLGDDVAADSWPSTGRPPRSREPISLILCKTDIAGGKVRIRPMNKGPLRVGRGQVVAVKHTYRLQEESSEREEYRFLLRSSLDGKQHPPSLARIGDQWGESEDISGYLEHKYTMDAPGEHTLWFAVGGEYTVMAWGDTEVKGMDRQETEGKILIVVD